MSTLLSVNLNKIALIRNSRQGNFPDLISHAQQCINAGAHGITIHPRPDQRHIRASDAQQLKDAINVELNIEGNPFATAYKSTQASVSDYPGFIPLVLETRPAQCTLVPDTHSQLTSDHGFNLHHHANTLSPIIKQLQQAGIRVSVFLDPDIQQISLAKEIGADRIELYTGPYAAAIHSKQTQSSTEELLMSYQQAATHAKTIGLGLNAGHDLNLHNLRQFKQALPQLDEVSIGHALIVDAIQFGLDNTVRRYLDCLQ